MCNAKKFGWTLVGIGVLFLGAGRASAQGGEGDKAGTEGLDCHDAGVTLTFKSGSTQLNGRARSSLNGVVKWLKEDPRRTARIDGYTDKTGNAQKNEVLSDRRAEAVERYIVSKGVAADRLEVSGHGEHTTRPDLINTRAVAVTACEGPKMAAAETPPAETPPAPAAEAPQPPMAQQPPAPPPTNISVNVMPMPPPQPQQPPPAVPPAPKKMTPISYVGVTTVIGGGATGFVDNGARSFVDTGGAWDARVSAGTRLPVSVEAAYIGSASALKSLGLENNALLLGNGVEGTVRLNFTTTRVQPYIFGGAGWINYRVENTQITTGDINRSDNILSVPFGIGLTGRVAQGFVIDLRGTGRAAFDDTLFDRAAAASGAGNSRLNSWSGTAQLGYEF
jgi:hypothetical protein